MKRFNCRHDIILWMWRKKVDLEQALQEKDF